MADVSDVSGQEEIEQLWARQIDSYRFEVCCIPFFVYDLALGDEVETDEFYRFRRVLKPSGRYVFRLWFGDSVQPIDPDQLSGALTKIGCQTEWSSNNLLAVDAATTATAEAVAEYLQEQEKQRRLTYETGRTR